MSRLVAHAALLAGAALLPIAAAQAAAAETAIASAATADAGGSGGADESEIVVSGNRPVSEAASGTKTNTPLIETPQSISVISAEQISHLGLANLNQALRYVAGVTPETRGANAELYDQFKLRGFDAPVYLDGLKQFGSTTGYAVPQVDVSRIDRIDIVKGPASVLYGQSSPGGLVAISSKLPLERDFYGAVSGTYGTYDLYRVDADVGGRVGGDALWRLNGSVNGAHTQQYFGKRERRTVSGAVTLGAGGDTTFTLLGAYSHDPYNGNYSGQPAEGTLFPNPNGKVSTRFADGEPGGYFRRDQYAGTYIFTHRFSPDWAFRSSGRYQYVRSSLGSIYSTGQATDATLTTFGRGSYVTRENLNNWTYDNQLAGKLTTGPVTHTILIGLDRQVAHSYERGAFGGATPINAFDPVYGTTPVPQSPDDTIGGTPFVMRAKLRQTGLYAQDQMAWGGLRLTLSGRQDWARTLQLYNGAGDPQKDRKFTYRVGGLYLTPVGLAPYVSYSTSFEPQLATVLKSDGSTGPASPSQGKQFEVGAKFQPPGTQILVTAAYFRITQDGLVAGIPNSSFSNQSGRVHSRGFEAEATVPLPHDILVKAAFSHQKVGPQQDALIGVGKGNASLNVDWAPKTGPLAGLDIGGGLRWVDKVYGGQFGGGEFDLPPTRDTTPSYTLFDALLRYDLGQANPRWKGVEIGINATNIFDKKYLTSCYLTSFNGWCWYGQRRTVQGTIGFRW